MGKLTHSLTRPDFLPADQRTNQLVTKTVKEKVLCVIDHSSSMSIEFGTSTRMEAVRNALLLIVDASSRAVTELGLIMFDDSSDLLAPMSDKFNAVKAGALRIEPAGGTSYAPALKAALKQKPNRIILLSDGEAGDKHRALEEARNAKAQGVKIDTVGVGDREVTLLQTIAELTGGVYSFCDNLAKLQDTFAKLETRARLQLEHKA